MHKSLWSDKTILPEFDPVTHDMKTDVLIIGGGICGLLCAYKLHNAGVNYILVEGNRIASGTTMNTTAKITVQHGIIYSKLLAGFGAEKAQIYLAANQQALLEYQKLCEKNDCDFQTKDAFTYSLTNRAKIESEVAAVNKLGLDADFVENTELPFDIKGAVRFKNQAQFNPLKFISAIVPDLNIYENTFIREITPYSVKTEHGRIRAHKIIVATHFPFINKHGSYFLKLYQHRSYVSAFENAPSLEGMYVDEDKKGLSFRNYENYLLVGGGGHRTGKKSPAWSVSQSFVKKHCPDAKLKYQWAAQDCMSLDGIPYIGKYSSSTPNLYVATGFNKWGMTSSMVAANILTDMVLDRKNDFAEVFSPGRNILKPQLALNGIESVLNLISPTTRRCPHLGCALKWNRAEHSWDCPCHGSRFDKDGKLIDNPATGDAKIN